MKKKKVVVLVIVLILIVGALIGSYFIFFKKDEVVSTVPDVKVTNEISSYGYTLDDRDTELFKEKFNELKELLADENFDVEDYVSLVSQLFIIDLYTIDNKISKYDVGGLEYVYEPARDSFKSVAMDSIYKTVTNNIDEKREQSLPVVDSVTVNDISTGSYELPDSTVTDSYVVNLSWTYENKLGYDNEGVLELIKNENKYDVVKFEPEE